MNCLHHYENDQLVTCFWCKAKIHPIDVYIIRGKKTCLECYSDSCDRQADEAKERNREKDHN